MSNLHVSVRRKDEASKTLTMKLKVLEKWILEGIPLLLEDDGTPIRDQDGEQQLDYVPKSLASLADWNGIQNCKITREKYGLAFKRTSRMTFDSHPELKVALQDKIKKINTSARTQREALNKHAVIASLSAELSRAQALINQQNKEIAEFQVKRRSLEMKYIAKSKSLQGARLEHQRVVRRLEARIADLTARLQKVTPLGLHK
jgi:hypothetical protein